MKFVSICHGSLILNFINFRIPKGATDYTHLERQVRKMQYKINDLLDPIVIEVDTFLKK